MEHMTNKRRLDPAEYNPTVDRAIDRSTRIFGMSRNYFFRRVVPVLAIALILWIVTRARDSYDRSVADPPLPSSRFVAESSRSADRRVEFYGNMRVDSVISAQRFQQISEQFEALKQQNTVILHRLDCLSRPHSFGC